MKKIKNGKTPKRIKRKKRTKLLFWSILHPLSSQFSLFITLIHIENSRIQQRFPSNLSFPLKKSCLQPEPDVPSLCTLYLSCYPKEMKSILLLVTSLLVLPCQKWTNLLVNGNCSTRRSLKMLCDSFFSCVNTMLMNL
ncbi:uncharacterized protein LOC132606279 [Lycium barbarum]|uniref:uncharacterized protein LOC132606279 n=1 Tax=Lycium barbarum TaxID=112863 RepID=UPI00293F4DBE|nr:uncharacterized protein LOC132606279 [Lycium barbarum]